MKLLFPALLVSSLAGPALAQHEGHDVGGLWSFNFVPEGLEPSYGGDRDGAMVFPRVTID